MNEISNTVNTTLHSGLSLDAFIQTSPIAIIRINEHSQIIEHNVTFEALIKHSLDTDTINGTSIIDLISPEEHTEYNAAIHAALNTEENQTAPMYFTLALPNSEQVIASTYITRIAVPESEAPLLVLHFIDHTEQKNLEVRFAHSQKMQAVGQLAGGVAHDFNNLLTAMIGFCDLLLMRHPAGDPSFADIMQIKQNANRAANLVRQLLAFSRRQTLQPKTIDVTDLLAELSNLIRRLIGENIAFNMSHGRDLSCVKADQGQLEQVIINLAVNARDAMKEGGILTIRTSDVTISSTSPVPKHFKTPFEEDQITNGDYILIEVEDTGTGIPHDMIEQVFEPFFSTKEVGSGTGLGLATVYGIIKQTDGYVYVSSTEGEGTTFALYLPVHQKECVNEEQSVQEDLRAADLTGKATILLVEDETPVRTFAARALSNKGYEVLEAESGEHALDVYAENADTIDVIISDVVMPGMNGPKMLTTLEERYPEKLAKVKVVFISGYAEDAFVDSFGEERSFNFLPKPFTLKQLAGKVKEVTSG